VRACNNQLLRAGKRWRILRDFNAQNIFLAQPTFGPKAPTGKENNWIQTVPGKGWNTLLRLYGPLQPWFDKTWRPSEIEPLE